LAEASLLTEEIFGFLGGIDDIVGNNDVGGQKSEGMKKNLTLSPPFFTNASLRGTKQSSIDG
jgi:hypothetical protein